MRWCGWISFLSHARVCSFHLTALMFSPQLPIPVLVLSAVWPCAYMGGVFACLLASRGSYRRLCHSPAPSAYLLRQGLRTPKETMEDMVAAIGVL